MRELKAKEFYKILAENGVDPDKLQEILVGRLTEKGKKIATAESCTGGLISKRITEVSGSSGVFDCGVCSYANAIKHKVLGVSQTDLDALGAVSAEVSVQMAEGVRKLAEADCSVSTTGIAGPTGGTPEKPVGLVYISYSDGKTSETIKALFGDLKEPTRENIRKAASDVALWLAIKNTN